MLTLTLQNAIPHPVELTGLTPDRLTSASPAEIARMTILVGNRREPVGEHFDIVGDPTDQRMMLLGELAKVKQIGAGMTAGELVVESSVGLHAGARMTGGRLTIRGHAGDWTGAEMTGGILEILGHAGHQLGAAYRGERLGMRGGTILVRGDAGDEVGLKMRRGLIVIGGRCGAFAGTAMVAGTLVASEFGPHAGAGLKRGTLVSVSRPSRSPGWRYSARYDGAYLGLLARHLIELAAPQMPELATQAADYYRGDALTSGRGEWFALGGLG